MRWLDGITDSVDMFEPTPGDGEGQGSPVYCSPRGRKESDRTERLNNSFMLLMVKVPSIFHRFGGEINS